VLPGGTGAFRDASRPFGMELDGTLVVDIADDESAALEAGVEIGWNVLSVGGVAVPAEPESAATKALRTAETEASSDGVCISFRTGEPEHWKSAVQ